MCGASAPQDDPSTLSRMRIAIIGAGLGGLASAHRLLAAGFQVDVYERDTALQARFQGYRITLEEAGFAALRRAVPTRLHELLEAIGDEFHGTTRTVDPQLTTLDKPEFSHHGRMFDRNVLRHLLFAGVADHVRFGHRFERYTELPDGNVELAFADGRSASADLVIGADGLGSKVRRQLLPQVEMRELPICAAIGRTPLTERFAGLVSGRSLFVTSPDIQLMLGAMRFRRSPALAAQTMAPDVRLPDVSSYIRWVFLMPGPAPADGDPSRILDSIREWHPELRALVRHADPENSGIVPMRLGDPLPAWQTRAVTLLGDAGHLAPPGGNGANVALLHTDQLAAELIEVRDGDSDLPTAVARYEQRLREYTAIGRTEVERVYDNFARLRADSR
ncbi:NAD(P)-binding protein [Nocardia arthritidis]|uniref:NAD(P)-binding protein n=2 Tax=Nocardia arthritidis TaxID=228602 RepID=A0A6G9YEE7_9NOCA|nr:NAD(P)-binding protein [Nocardia arthritidis]